jgi:methylmalonyl-CoA mutase N-terminal domain/subunit
MELIERSDSLGGSVAAIAEGFFQEEIARSAYEHQMRVESGETTVVGVNRFADSNEALTIPAPDYSSLEADQVRSLAGVKAKRDSREVEECLESLRKRAAALLDHGERPPVMPSIIEAVRARCTIGEISGAFLHVWGAYSPATSGRT